MNKKIMLGVALALGLSTSAMAQSSSTATANASVHVIHPIVLIWEQPLAFGGIIPDNVNAGTVTVAPASSPVTTSAYVPGSPTAVNVTLLNTPATGTAPGPATFLVQGESNYTYAVTLPNAVIVHIDNITDNSIQMIVDQFTSDLPGSPLTPVGHLSNTPTGAQYFSVGGTLHVPAGETPGQYSGQFQVSVAYN
jgi:hypothetical protein